LPRCDLAATHLRAQSTFLVMWNLRANNEPAMIVLKVYPMATY